MEKKEPNQLHDGTNKSQEEKLRERQAKKAAKKNAGLKGAVKESNPKPASAPTSATTAASTNEVKSKNQKQIRAERTATQDAQRAAKTATAAVATSTPAVPAATEPTNKPNKVVVVKQRVPDQIQADRAAVEKRRVKKLVSQQVPQLPPAQRKVQLFAHLQQHEKSLHLLTKELKVSQDMIHPAIIKLGLQYASGVVRGSNARALALTNAIKKVISDYSTPLHKELSRDLEASLKPNINFLKQCRPMSVTMGNAIRYIKRQITATPADYSEAHAKEYLHDAIDKYTLENIELAGRAICTEAGKKIVSGDVILTYGHSSLLLRILLTAYVDDGKRFRVVVLDGAGAGREGLQFLRRLTAHRIPAVYMLITGASYIMPQVTKVFLGAHALLANGNVMSRVGSSQVALVAKAHNVPVLVCCETHKFSERVQTDSFVLNELGDPDDLIRNRSTACDNWRSVDKLSLLNLTYDVTPGDLVTAVITELAVLPCTSVPVVLRVKHADVAVV